jgi:hypothetical protein
MTLGFGCPLARQKDTLGKGAWGLCQERCFRPDTPG